MSSRVRCSAPTGTTRRSSGPTTQMRSADSRTRSTATSTSAAAGRSYAGCSPTGSSTNCICTSSQSRSAPASDCSPMVRRPNSRSRRATFTTTASCTWATARPSRPIADLRPHARRAQNPHVVRALRTGAEQHTNPLRDKHCPAVDTARPQADPYRHDPAVANGHGRRRDPCPNRGRIGVRPARSLAGRWRPALC